MRLLRQLAILTILDLEISGRPLSATGDPANLTQSPRRKVGIPTRLVAVFNFIKSKEGCPKGGRDPHVSLGNKFRVNRESRES